MVENKFVRCNSDSYGFVKMISKANLGGVVEMNDLWTTKMILEVEGIQDEQKKKQGKCDLLVIETYLVENDFSPWIVDLGAID